MTAPIKSIFFVLFFMHGTTVKAFSNTTPLFKVQSRLNGHWGYLKQNYSEYPLENPLGAKIIAQKAYEFMFLPKNEVLKFLSVETRPHMSVIRDEEGFTICGPFYSIVYEAAKYINYSIDGINIMNEERNAAFVVFKPDFVVSLLWPQLDYMKVVWEDDPFGVAVFGIKKVSWLTAPIGVLEMDYVWYFKRTQSPDLFAFLKTFDGLTSTLILFSSSAVAILLCFSGDVNKSLARNLGLNLFNTTTAIITFTSKFKFRNDMTPFVKWTTLTWLAITMILQQFFGGDMVARLAMDPKPIVIDSLQDLVGKSMKIRAVNFKLVDGQVHSDAALEYFNKDRDYYQDLTPRLIMMNFSEIVDIKLRASNVLGTPWEPPPQDNCLVCKKLWAEDMKNNLYDGYYRDISHVSREGADAQMHAFARTLSADPKESRAMDYVIIHLNEAGIYQKWLDVAVFGINKVEEKESLMSYEISKVGDFLGPAIVCAIGFFIATTLLAVENIVFRLKKRSERERRRQRHDKFLERVERAEERVYRPEILASHRHSLFEVWMQILNSRLGSGDRLSNADS